MKYLWLVSPHDDMSTPKKEREKEREAERALRKEGEDNDLKTSTSFEEDMWVGWLEAVEVIWTSLWSEKESIAKQRVGGAKRGQEEMGVQSKRMKPSTRRV